ncbi:MAG: hypothetical protein ACREKL_08650 [Chthoniobacterales bacterium]
MKPTLPSSRFLITLILPLALAGFAHAANNTWKGQNANWNDNANWTTPLLSGDFLTFPLAPIAGGTGVTNLINNSGFTVFSGITFTPGAGNYTITNTGTVNLGPLTVGVNDSGALLQRGGVYTFVSTYDGSNTVMTLNIGTNGSVGDGNVLNLVSSGGVNGTTNKIVLAGAQTGFLRSRDFFNGSDYVYNDATGFIRAPVYGVDAGFLDAGGLAMNTNSHYLVTTDIASQPAYNSLGGAGTFINTIKFSGGVGTHQNITQDSGTLLQIGSSAGGSAGGGILRTGGGSTTITGGTLEMGNGNNLYFRTDSATDTLIIESNIAATSTNNMVKNGAGTVAINGTDSATGSSWVNEGTLLVNGTHTTGTNYMVNPGATLGGTGLLGGGVNTIQINGTLSPGNSLLAADSQTGSLDIGGSALNFTTGSNVVFQIGGPTPGDGIGNYDQVNAINPAGAINLQTGVSISFALVNGYIPVPGDIFYVLTRADALAFTTLFTGTTEGGVVDLGGGNFANITYQADSFLQTLTGGNDVAIYLDAVPEPGPLALVALGMVATIFRFRRRRAH